MSNINIEDKILKRYKFYCKMYKNSDSLFSGGKLMATRLIGIDLGISQEVFDDLDYRYDLDISTKKLDEKIKRS